MAQLGLIVIVDTSDSSIDNHRCAEARQILIYVEKLSMKELHSIPKYSKVLKRLDELGKTHIMEILIGGVPIEYNKLLIKNVISGIYYKNQEEKITMKSNHVEEVKLLINNYFGSSLLRVNNMISKNKENTKFMDFLNKFKNLPDDYIANINEKNLILGIEDSCFRITYKNNKSDIHIVAVNNSVNIILKFELYNDEIFQKFDFDKFLSTNSLTELNNYFLEKDLKKDDKRNKENEKNNENQKSENNKPVKDSN